MNAARSSTKSGSRRTLWLQPVIATICAILVMFMLIPVKPVAIPANPISEQFLAKHLSRVRIRFVENGITQFCNKDREGSWFAVPLDVRGKIEPIAASTHFTTSISSSLVPGMDLAEVVLESKRENVLTLRILYVDNNCSCFNMRHGLNVFVYKNTDDNITSDFLSNVAILVLSQFQEGDSPSARIQSESGLNLFSRLDEEIRASVNK